MKKKFFLRLPARLLLAVVICALLPLRGEAALTSSAEDPLRSLQREAAIIRADGIPVVRSTEEGQLLGAEILGRIPQPFPAVAEIMADPRQWCEIVPLHLNVKACLVSRGGAVPVLTFYLGRKFYQPPGEATPMTYNFQVMEAGKGYFRILLTAPKGPLDTRDYRLEVEGIPEGRGTFLRFRISYLRSLASKMATGGYLGTAGRDKVGFTVTGSEKGRPRYVGGIRGIIERNAMRYYLALEAYFSTHRLPPEKRFEARLLRWFDLTERFRKQLHEMKREEYLEAKRRERRNQEALQRNIDG